MAFNDKEPQGVVGRCRCKGLHLPQSVRAEISMRTPSQSFCVLVLRVAARPRRVRTVPYCTPSMYRSSLSVMRFYTIHALGAYTGSLDGEASPDKPDADAPHLLSRHARRPAVMRNTQGAREFRCGVRIGSACSDAGRTEALIRGSRGAERHHPRYRPQRRAQMTRRRWATAQPLQRG